MTDVPPHLRGTALAAVRHAWRGQIAAARAVAAVEAPLVRADVELRAGAWDAAAGLLDGCDSEPAVWSLRALLAAGRGEVDAARALATEAQVAAEAAGDRWSHLEAWRAHGLAAIVAGEPDRAVAALDHVWQHTGRDEPGAFPVAPDLVELLIEVGDRDRAEPVVARLAAARDDPWAALGTRRGRALLGEDTADLGRVAAAYAGLGLRFDAARTLLALGRLQRRRRRWTAARHALTAAVEAFATPGWAALAEDELGRIGARRARPAPDALTAAERRVAVLAAEGRANREIAGALGVTVNTVETHLTRAYAKLGVSGRAGLAAALEA